MKKRIEGKVKSVRELLQGSRYTIDFYQREYAWKTRQVHELIDDLTGRFLDFHQPGHERQEVAHYGHYFLGAVVISHKDGLKYIVDGQQRLTTLTLILIHLEALQKGREGKVNILDLVFSERYGNRDFNLNVPDRLECMNALFNGENVSLDDASESVKNIAERFDDICEYFPEEVSGQSLFYFIDWISDNVHFVEIEAYSDEDAYTIFETMNDRGLSLSLPEMLKGYILASIKGEEAQRTVNDIWKSHIQKLRNFDSNEDADFFKAWLRAKYAKTIRPGKKGAENKDFERIGSEFHRWVRDHRDDLNLKSSSDFVSFVARDLDFFARQTAIIRRASTHLEAGLESIWYNANRRFTLQTQLLLAPLTPNESSDTVKRKLALTADFMDIWLARRIWNFRTTSQAAVKHTLFNLTLAVRDISLEDLSENLKTVLAEQEETFASNLDFRLHGTNMHQVRHILARITHWLDSQCGYPSNFQDLVAPVKSKKFEIEHIWANHFDQFQEDFTHISDFEQARNRLGGLVLLQQGHNQSLGDMPFEKKRNAYATHSHNLLAGSLSPMVYENNPSFRKLIETTGLAFKPYDEFNLEAQAERQELYLRLAEWVWNPSRLNLDGVTPPIHEPIDDPEDRVPSPVKKTERFARRFEFWTGLLELAKARQSLHASLGPRYQHWVGKREHRLDWVFTVLREQCRVELYIDQGDSTSNKTKFDELFAQKEEIEREYGHPLTWERLDEKKACRISQSLEGGWAEQGDRGPLYGTLITQMERLYAVLSPRASRD